jgi:hypothetical protein
MGQEVDLQSINDSANLLVELAGALGVGRPDHELSHRAGAPASPQDVSDAVRRFADFGADQYQDLVALLAALSTKLQDSRHTYATAEDLNTTVLTRFLQESQYIPPDRRTAR